MAECPLLLADCCQTSCLSCRLWEAGLWDPWPRCSWETEATRCTSTKLGQASTGSFSFGFGTPTVNNVFLLLSSFLSLESLLDIRTDTNYEGRSINLALSRRGIASLEKIGWNQKNVEDTGLPMQGRLIHSLKGDLTSIPYGLHGEVLLPRPFFCLFEKYFLKSCLFSVFVFEPRSAFTLLTAGS